MLTHLRVHTQEYREERGRRRREEARKGWRRKMRKWARAEGRRAKKEKEAIRAREREVAERAAMRSEAGICRPIGDDGQGRPVRSAALGKTYKEARDWTRKEEGAASSQTRKSVRWQRAKGAEVGMAMLWRIEGKMPMVRPRPKRTDGDG